MSNELISLDIINSDDRLFGGWASVEVVDRQGEYVPTTELAKAMISYMSRGGIVIYGHENKPTGNVLYWDIRKHSNGKLGVYIIGQINKGYKQDDVVWNMIKNNDLKGFSIAGFAKTEKEIIKDENGNTKEVNVLKGIELNEISIVDIPANPLSIIEEYNKFAKGIKTNDIPELMAKVVNLIGDKVEKDILEQIMQIIVDYNKNNSNDVGANETEVIDVGIVSTNPIYNENVEAMKMNIKKDDIENSKNEDDEVVERVEEESGKEEFETENNEKVEKDEGIIDSNNIEYSNPRYGKRKRKYIINDIDKVEKGMAKCYYNYLKILKKLKVFDWKNGLNEQQFNQVVKGDDSRYMNEDRSFKEMTCPDNPQDKSKFCGCVRYFMSKKNKSLESANKLCAYIKQHK